MVTVGMSLNLKQDNHLRRTRDRSRENRDEFVIYISANKVYAEAGCPFSARSNYIRMSAQCPTHLHLSQL